MLPPVPIGHAFLECCVSIGNPLTLAMSVADVQQGFLEMAEPAAKPPDQVLSNFLEFLIVLKTKAVSEPEAVWHYNTMCFKVKPQCLFLTVNTLTWQAAHPISGVPVSQQWDALSHLPLVEFFRTGLIRGTNHHICISATAQTYNFKTCFLLRGIGTWHMPVPLCFPSLLTHLWQGICSPR